MKIASGKTDQYIYFVAVDSSDYVTRETGLSGFTVYRSRDGAAATAMTTPTINEVDSTNMPGVYELLLDEDMTIDAANDTEEMVFHITKTGMAPVTRTIEIYRPKITTGYTLGVNASGHVSRVVLNDTTTTNTDMVDVSSLATAANLATVDTVVDGIKAVTDNLPNSGALSDLATASAVTTVDTVVDGIKSVTDNLPNSGALTDLATASAVTTVDTVVDGIKAVTDNLPNSGALTDLATSSALATVDTVVDGVKAVTDNLPNSGALTDLATASALATTDAVCDAIKAVTDTLSVSAISDGVWDESQSGHTSAGTFGYYLDSRVSQAGGGDTGVTYIVGHVPDRAGPTDLMIFAGEAVSPVIETRDASCTPVDLSSKTMKVVIEKADGTDLETIASGSITVTTTTVSFPISTTTTNSGEKSVNWSLRDASTAEVYLYGTFYIQTVAI